MGLSGFFDAAVTVFEVAGVTVMLAGLAIAVAHALIRFVRTRSGAETQRILRTTIGGSILLGLEILVAADLVKTVTSELALENVLSLGLIVIIRTVLSFTIEVELEGTLPWRRALLPNGARVLAKGFAE